MSTIAVIGPGAIGGVAAAWLAQGGHEVTLCARTPLAEFDRELVAYAAPHRVEHLVH